MNGQAEASRPQPADPIDCSETISTCLSSVNVLTAGPSTPLRVGREEGAALKHLLLCPSTAPKQSKTVMSHDSFPSGEQGRCS
ncbi:hypothetical protein E2C01_028379 [Portunus trituberculatus]|uniref:Uncharacterized protein n=1 Tax=Portunus trituberculatus TaxID=210409 RepID=A0A5B7EPV3_PORTR|nr:hypothetical protein [Portunus trituberculatus]